MADSRATNRHFHVEAVRSGLHEQVVGGLVHLPERAWRAVYLDAGRLRLCEDGTERLVAAPCFVWRPWAATGRIRASAGSIVATLLLSDTMLANTIGHRPEAADIRLMLDRAFEVDLSDSPETCDGLAASFGEMLAEQSRDSLGSAAIVEAHARIVTVLIWRLISANEAIATAAHRNSRVLQQFRQLLETHFRERWHVGQYASAVGLSRDRLNDLCQRMVGRSPRRLIRERLMYEARLLLDRSSRTNEEIAAMLGFSDVAHFSKSFKAETGMPPGRYRARVLDDGASMASDSRSYADWP